MDLVRNLILSLVFFDGYYSEDDSFLGNQYCGYAIFVFVLKQITAEEDRRRVGKCLSPTGSAFIPSVTLSGRADYRTCLQYVPPANNGFIYTLGSFNDLSRVIPVFIIYLMLCSVFLGLIIGFCWIQYQPFLYNSLYFLFDRSLWVKLISGG